MRRQYSGTFNTELLQEQILAAFPQWATTRFGLPWTLFTIFILGEDGNRVTDMEIEIPDEAAWPQVEAIIAAHDPNGLSQEDIFLNKVIAIAQTAVGVAVQNLTTAQRNALLVGMAYKLGVLDKDLVVRPLGEWL